MSAAHAARARWSAPGLLLVLLLGTLLPSGGARAQGCGDTLVADGTAGSCAADGGGAGGTSPLDPVAPDDAGSAGADPLAPPSSVGNPISLFTGNKREVETDFALPEAALAFRRFYNSANEAWRSGVGQGWSHTYAVTLFATPDGARELLQSDGRRLHFAPAGTDEEGRTIFRTGSAFEGTLVATADNAHRWELPDGRHLLFNGSYLIEIDWPDQRHLSLYYQQQRLASVTDETGRVLRLAYWPGVPGADRALGGYRAQAFGPASGQLASLTLPDGEVIGYEYDQRSNLTRTVYPDGTQRQYHYEDATYPSHLTGLTDRTGVRFASWTYDGQGRAISSEHAGGVERVMLAYPKASAIEAGRTVGTTVTNSLGQSSRYTWEQPVGGSPRLLEGTGSGCASCPPTGMRWTYGTTGRLVAATVTGKGTAVGSGTLHYAHDEAGRLAAVQRTLLDGTRVPVERREYEGASLRVAKRIRPSVRPDAEHVIATSYTDRGLIAEITETGFRPLFDAPPPGGRSVPVPSGFAPIVRSIRFTYDENRLVEIDGPLEGAVDITRLDWDERARLVAVHPPAAPAVRVLAFDGSGRPSQVRFGTGETIRLDRDAGGSLIGAHGGSTRIRHERDAEGRLMGTTGPGARSAVRYRRDAAGRVEAMTRANGPDVERVRDREGRLVEHRLLGQDGVAFRTLTASFDPRARIEGIVETRSGDEGVFTRSFAPGVQGGTVPGEGGSPEAAGWRMRDDFGRRVLSGDPDTGPVVDGHDPGGRRVERHRSDGSSTRIERDAAGRAVSRTDADGTRTRWRWDETRDLLLETVTESTTERFEYDAAGRLERHVRQIDGQRFETAWTRDAKGRVLDRRLPDGQVLRHRYHETGPNAGELRSIVRRGRFGVGGQALVAQIDLDATDGRSGWIATDGRRADYRHAANGDIRSLEIEGTLDIDYRFDAAGNLVGMRVDGDGARYGYRNGRLTSVVTPRRTYRWRYDARGNRVEEQVVSVGGEAAFTYSRYGDADGGNRLRERVDLLAGRVESFRYGANGAPLAAGELDYTRDSRGRALSVSRDGVLLASYAYNAFGQRVRKSVYGEDGSPSVTRYLYDGIKLVAEIDGNGEIAAQYVYLDGHRPVAMLADGVAYAIHTDHLGTPRRMTDPDGRTVWSADYAPFGEATVSVQEVPLALRLPGQYEDAETGLHYNHFRDYDPAAGRYLGADPAGRPDGPNRYLYALARPLERTDVLGLWSRGDTLSRARLAELDGDPAEIARFVTEELDGFGDRNRFYQYAHDTLNTTDDAEQTDWFQAAADVNRWNQLQPAELPAWATPLKEDTDDYLTYAGMALALQNVQTFITLMRGDDIAAIGCLHGDELDLALVGYEQRQLSRIGDHFFQGPLDDGEVYARPDGIYGNQEAGQIIEAHFTDPWFTVELPIVGEEVAVVPDADFFTEDRDRDEVEDDINDLMNPRGVTRPVFEAISDEGTVEVVNTLFPEGFDIGSESDRIKLGQALVRRNNGQEWEDQSLYD